MNQANGSKRLYGRVVLIIGAGREPGPELAQALAAQGASIAANDITPVLLDPLQASIQAAGGQIQTYVADATRGMPLRALLDEVLENHQRIDILINNPRVQPAKPLLEMDEYDWQRTLEVNLNGTFLITQQVARLMRDQGQGTIIHLVDTRADVLQAPGHSAYAASQAGLQALSQAAARELIAYNIRVHAICPLTQPTNGSEDPASRRLLTEQVINLCQAGPSQEE